MEAVITILVFTLIIAVLVIYQQETQIRSLRVRLRVMEGVDNMPKYDNPPPPPTSVKDFITLEKIPKCYMEVPEHVYKDKLGAYRFSRIVFVNEKSIYIAPKRHFNHEEINN